MALEGKSLSSLDIKIAVKEIKENTKDYGDDQFNANSGKAIWELRDREVKNGFSGAWIESFDSNIDGKLYYKISDGYKLFMAQKTSSSNQNTIKSNDRGEKECEKNMSERDLRRTKSFFTIAKELSITVGTNFDVDHSQSMFDSDTNHFPDNLQILTSSLNRSKGKNSWKRHTYEENIEYLKREFMAVATGRFNDPNFTSNKKRFDEILDNLYYIY